MYKKFIKKINNWIQWTKQWHFFHILFVGSFLMYNWFPYIGMPFDIITGICYIIKKLGISNNPPTDDNDIFGWAILTAAVLFMFLFTTLLNSVIGLLTEIIIYFIRKKKCKPITVQSSFLLNNKIYNFIYINCIIGFLYSFIVFVGCFSYM